MGFAERCIFAHHPPLAVRLALSRAEYSPRAVLVPRAESHPRSRGVIAWRPGFLVPACLPCLPARSLPENSWLGNAWFSRGEGGNETQKNPALIAVVIGSALRILRRSHLRCKTRHTLGGTHTESPTVPKARLRGPTGANRLPHQHSRCGNRLQHDSTGCC